MSLMVIHCGQAHQIIMRGRDAEGEVGLARAAQENAANPAKCMENR
jgi:hypothetical protein